MAGMNETDVELLATAIVYGSPAMINAVGIKLSVAQLERIFEAARQGFAEASVTVREFSEGLLILGSCKGS